MQEFFESILVTPQKNNDARCIKQAIDKLSTIQNSHQLSGNSLSTLFCTSERNLRRKCHKYFAMTPSELLIRLRIYHAKQQLNNHENISAVSDCLGFATHSYFSSVFKKYEGITPQQYVQQQKK